MATQTIYYTRKSLVKHVLSPVKEVTVIESVAGWPGYSCNIVLMPGEYLELVKNGDAEHWSQFIKKIQTADDDYPKPGDVYKHEDGSRYELNEVKAKGISYFILISEDRGTQWCGTQNNITPMDAFGGCFAKFQRVK